MGWFDEQIRIRKAQDNAAFEEAFLNIAGAVIGEKLTKTLKEGGRATGDAICEVLRYYDISYDFVPDEKADLEDQLESMTHPYGIMRRMVRLDKGWYNNAFGTFLGTKKDGGVVAMLPGKYTGYVIYDPENDEYIKVTKDTEDMLEEEAICFYRAFPHEKLTIRSLFGFVVQVINPSDWIRVSICTAAAALAGLCATFATGSMVARIGSFDIGPVLAVGIFLLCSSISNILFKTIREYLTGNIQARIRVASEAATIIRVISLPVHFFKRYTAGELNVRVEYVNRLCEILGTSVLYIGFSEIFSLVYLLQILFYAKKLFVPALGVYLLTLLSSIIFTLLQTNILFKEQESTAAERGMSYAVIEGIEKIRIAGAEKRAFAKWGNLYADEVGYKYNANSFARALLVVNTAISVAGTAVIYYVAAKQGIGISNYYAFVSAYGMATGAMMVYSSMSADLASIPAILKTIGPILEEVPEVSSGKKVMSRLSGGIELNNVTFRYDEMMPPVCHNLSLRIRPGEYVAIVGPTGCGKSTLLRLLLGFETPQRGAIYYDGRDLSSIDLKSLRRRIGIVLQDEMLFNGSIFSNISIAAPGMTMEEAWEVAEKVDIAEDIRRMPMGMHTMVQEGRGNISGGQRQRLIIASAIAPKPKILIFDEATSALDNLSQEKIAAALDGMKGCTRILVAHRLSTIRNCDRILVLDEGRIVEEGTYDDLIAREGFFTKLVNRQRING